jgi:hypothetical protein
MEKGKNFLLAIFEDEDELVHGVEDIRKEGIKIQEVFTPFPVHGLDTALGYKPSNLPVASFLFGLAGMCLGLTMMIAMMGYDWPMNIGGKPYVPIADFIPITFEATVLIASLGMVSTFLYLCDLGPWNYKPEMFDFRSTDDKFVMVIDLAKNHIENDQLTSLLKHHGAKEVNFKSLI